MSGGREALTLSRLRERVAEHEVRSRVRGVQTYLFRRQTATDRPSSGGFAATFSRPREKGE